MMTCKEYRDSQNNHQALIGIWTKVRTDNARNSDDHSAWKTAHENRFVEETFHVNSILLGTIQLKFHLTRRNSYEIPFDEETFHVNSILLGDNPYEIPFDKETSSVNSILLQWIKFISLKNWRHVHPLSTRDILYDFSLNQLIWSILVWQVRENML